MPRKVFAPGEEVEFLPQPARFALVATWVTGRYEGRTEDGWHIVIADDARRACVPTRRVRHPRPESKQFLNAESVEVLIGETWSPGCYDMPSARAGWHWVLLDEGGAAEVADASIRRVQ